MISLSLQASWVMVGGVQALSASFWLPVLHRLPAHGLRGTSGRLPGSDNGCWRPSVFLISHQTRSGARSRSRTAPAVNESGFDPRILCDKDPLPSSSYFSPAKSTRPLGHPHTLPHSHKTLQASPGALVVVG